MLRIITRLTFHKVAEFMDLTVCLMYIGGREGRYPYMLFITERYCEVKEKSIRNFSFVFDFEKSRRV